MIDSAALKAELTGDPKAIGYAPPLAAGKVPSVPEAAVQAVADYITQIKVENDV